MKIKINLKDPESCEGCPMIYEFDCGHYDSREDIGCILSYEGNWDYERYTSYYKRPKRCKEENGL